jgi:AraC family transcriptional regulator of adaptative response/methylated-DNA-[protein]-cysteine methyltransferase
MSLSVQKEPKSESVASGHAQNDPRWTAVLDRDASFDGDLVYAVKTTGIYCRPSCPSRRPKFENVCFFKTCEEAEKAGFRPCQRCRPLEASRGVQHAALIAKACQIIEAADEMPTVDVLARAIGMSQFHFHRVFKKITGVTPKAYVGAHRAKRIREELSARRNTVTSAIFSAGYNASSRFYETSDKILGMTLSAFKSGGAAAHIKFAVGECSLGSILVARSDKGICAIFLGDDPDALLRDLQDRFPKAHLIGGDAAFELLVAKVVGFVETPALGLDLPLDIQGTAFQLRVWQALCEIPFGETTSYTEIAQRIGRPKAVRAVAGACAANKISVIIPCHRVVKTDGALSGYRWGVERKRALLERERAASNAAEITAKDLKRR